MGPARALMRGSSAYLSVLFASTVLAIVLADVAPDGMVGPVAGIALVVLAGLVAAIVLWARTPSDGPLDGLTAWFVLAWLVLWLFLLTLTVVRVEEVSILAVVLPVVLVLVWRKPPSPVAALAAGDVLAGCATVAVVLTLALEMAGVVGSWYGPDGAALAAEDRSTYWLPLADLLGLDGRWAGPFVHPNLAGPVGAFLLVFGLTRRGLRRVVFAAVGVLVLLLTSSRTSQLSAVVGIVVIVAVWWLTRPSGLGRPARVFLLAAPLVAFVAALVIVNPTLTGRTSVWPVMTQLWEGAPVLGIGDQGFADAIEAGLLPPWAHHGHNIVFDALVRTGVVGVAFVLVVLALALVITTGAARRGQAVGLALVATLIVGGMADTTLHWRFLTVPMAVLLVAVLASRPSETVTQIT
jgi:O-antigen ligase